MKVFYFLLCVLCFTCNDLTGQNTAPALPQRTATIRAVQQLNFGDMTIVSGSSGGTVTVDSEGTRTATGRVILLNMGSTAQQAIFEFRLCPGRMVTVTYPTQIIMNGSNGGTLNLHVKPLRIGSVSIGAGSGTFTSNKGCDDIHLIHVGGTIDVGSTAANPSGSYTGTFQITFNQQ